MTTRVKLLTLALCALWITACGSAPQPAPSAISMPATFTPFAPEVKNSPTLIYPTKSIPSTPLTGARPSQTFTPAPDTATPTITATIPYEACGWVEAHQDLPEVSAALETALRAAVGEALRTARANVYGENCMLNQNTVGYFAAKETDFYVTLIITDVNNDEELGNLIALLLPVFDQFPLESLKGPMPGSINIAAQSGDQTRFLNFSRTMIVDFQGLTGAALINALSIR